MSKLSPVYLFADSQLLFWKKEGDLYLKDVLKYVSSQNPKAAYIGYSNGNIKDFYDIFQSAMEGIGIQCCRMLGEDFGDEDKAFVEDVSIILLSGGDVAQGWNKIADTGLKELVLKRFSEGAVLIGVSAGAVQLGMGTVSESGSNDAMDTFQILPFVVGAHQEAEDWKGLREQVLHKGGYTKGIGIPFGAGFVYHPDNTIEPIKGSVVEITLHENDARLNILFPDETTNNNGVLQ